MWTICSSLCIVFHRPARSVSIAALSISSSSLPLARLPRIFGNVRLGAAVFVEIAIDPVAERDDAEDLAGLGRFLGIQLFDGAAKLGQVGADAGILVDRLDRAVEEAVRRAGGFGDLLAAHRGQLVDLLAEFRAVGVERGELVDELRDALVELARFLGLERNQPGGFGRRDRLQAPRARSSFSLVLVSVAGSVAMITSFHCHGGAVADGERRQPRRARAFGCIIGAIQHGARDRRMVNAD